MTKLLALEEERLFAFCTAFCLPQKIKIERKNLAIELSGLN